MGNFLYRKFKIKEQIINNDDSSDDDDDEDENDDGNDNNDNGEGSDSGNPVNFPIINNPGIEKIDQHY